MTLTLPAHLSYSALSTYAECGERFRLQRGYGKDASTWFATVAGSAIHDITEQYDLLVDFGIGEDKPLPSFEEVFTERLRVEAERGVEVKASGRVTKEMTASGGPNKKDRDWWLRFGPEYVQRWFDWREENPHWKIAVMPDGQPGIEVKVESPMAGVPFKGFIDRVFIVGDSDIVVTDLKMGAVPASKLQLATYRVALLNDFGLDARWGGYWMGKDGEFAGQLTDLSQYDQRWLEYQFTMARKGIEAGVFLPNVTSMCKGCSVRDYCRAVGGTLASELPISDVVQITGPRVASSGASV